MAPRSGMRATLLLALWLLCQRTVHAQQGEAKLGTPISVPGTISAPGVYVLAQDFPSLNVASGAAIQITASDVVLDLNGHTLNNTAAGSVTTAYGILALDQSNVTVRNGNVQGFMSGVALVASDPTVSPSPSYGNLVEAMAVSACTYEGIALSGGSSVVRRSEVAQIGGSTLAGDYTSAYGIDLVGTGLRCLDCDVAAVTASGPAGGSYAIYVTGSADAFALDNRLSGMQYGIYFDETSATGQYRRNLASGISGQAYVGGTDAGDNIVDSNGDGIDDDWELAYFGTLNLDLAALAPSGSGLTILQSYQQGLNPIDFYNGQTPSLTIINSGSQSAAPGSFLPAPLVVRVTDANGNPIAGAPVTFSVVSGDGQLQATRQASPKTVVTVLTDANGQAQVFFQVSNTAGVTSGVSAALTGRVLPLRARSAERPTPTVRSTRRL